MKRKRNQISRTNQSYQTLIQVGNKFLDVDILYDFTPADPGVRYYPDGSGCPPSSACISIYGIHVIGIDFVDHYAPRDILEARGYLQAVEATANSEVFDNLGWYEDEIAADIDAYDDEPDHKDY